MTTATQEKAWGDIAIVNSTKVDKFGQPVIDPKTQLPLRYRIQQNGLGWRRCSCEAWRYADYPGKKLPEGHPDRKPHLRDCKHLRQFKRLETQTQSLTDAGAACWPKAVALVDQMVAVSLTVVPDAGKAGMAALLAEYLAKFTPPPASLGFTGGRFISFDED